MTSAKLIADHDGMYNFITEPEEDLKCSVRLKVATDPWQDEECGKLFCRKCILSSMEWTNLVFIVRKRSQSILKTREVSMVT